MLDDHAFARALAERAGDLLLELRQSMAEGPRLRDEGDRRSHELLASELRAARPGDAVLSEEAKDDPGRLNSRRVWIVDPLDGTREFGELDRTDWAVHVALADEGRLVAGAVALPARGMTFGTSPAPEVAPRRDGPLRIAVSRTRPPDIAGQVATRLDATLVPMGSAGAKVMAVLLGEVDAYLHAGGQWEWDSAAPVAVALAAGLHASRLDGAPLLYNQPRPWLPDLLVCRSEIAGAALSAVRASATAL